MYVPPPVPRVTHTNEDIEALRNDGREDEYAPMMDSHLSDEDSSSDEVSEVAELQATIGRMEDEIKQFSAAAFAEIGKRDAELRKIGRRNFTVAFLSAFSNGIVGTLGAGVGLAGKRALYNYSRPAQRRRSESPDR